MSLMDDLNEKAATLGIPLSAQLDITWRCNERCIHCYLDHEGRDEMSTDEIKEVLRQLAAAGTFFLSISGGEPLLRRDCFEILGAARALGFNVKLKTNAVMIRAAEARRLRQLGIEQVQISVYSDKDEVHDAITKLPGSLKRTVAAIGHLKSEGVKVSITNVLMKQNAASARGVHKLAQELGVSFVVDPTITPKFNGDTSLVQLRIPNDQLKDLFRQEEFVGNVQEFCSPPSTVDDSVLDGFSCSAGHTYCYISPSAELYPCVQFPMPCGNLRKQKFSELWGKSPALLELRSVHVRDLPTCSKCNHVSYCTRCPGLAYLEGNMRGPSTADCAKSEARMAGDELSIA
jgi:radical SAM protein with 4Fe4S-binding SPASM domain